MLRPRHFLLLLPLALALAVAGCGSEPTFGETRSFTPRERRVDWRADAATRLQLPDLSGRGGQDDPSSSQGATTFTGELPAGWEELPAQPQVFKDALFRVQGTETECYLTASVRGGTVGNVGRWATQFGAAAPDLAPLPVACNLLGRPAKLVELKGTFKGKPDQMLLGLITEGDEVTTFKFTGPSAVVGREKDHFLALASSLKPGAGKPPANGRAAPGGGPPGDATGFTADLPTG